MKIYSRLVKICRKSKFSGAVAKRDGNYQVKFYNNYFQLVCLKFTSFLDRKTVQTNVMVNIIQRRFK